MYYHPSGNFPSLVPGLWGKQKSYNGTTIPRIAAINVNFYYNFTYYNNVLLL
jgi:hypothetical protein